MWFSCLQALPTLGDGSDTGVGPILRNAPGGEPPSCAGPASRAVELWDAGVEGSLRHRHCPSVPCQQPWGKKYSSLTICALWAERFQHFLGSVLSALLVFSFLVFYDNPMQKTPITTSV